MRQHKLEGDKCLVCGQQGLELEDECPVDVSALVRSQPAKPYKTPVSPETQRKLDRIKVIKASDLPAATAKAPKLTTSAPDDTPPAHLEEVARRGLARVGQGVRTRRSWNESQNMLYLDALARALLDRIPRHIKEGTKFDGEELKRTLATYNLEARHTDQWEAIDNPP